MLKLHNKKKYAALIAVIVLFVWYVGQHEWIVVPSKMSLELDTPLDNLDSMHHALFRPLRRQYALISLDMQVKNICFSINPVCA